MANKAEIKASCEAYDANNGDTQWDDMKAALEAAERERRTQADKMIAAWNKDEAPLEKRLHDALVLATGDAAIF